MKTAYLLRRIVLLSMECLYLQYFLTLSHKWQDFRGGKKKFTEHKICAVICSTNVSETLRRIQSDTGINVHKSS
jgi:hypothetical protein